MPARDRRRAFLLVAFLAACTSVALSVRVAPPPAPDPYRHSLGAHEVELYFADGQHVPRPAWAASVTGSGLPEDAEAWDLVIARLLPAAVPPGAPTLDASWAGLEGTLALAWLE